MKNVNPTELTDLQWLLLRHLNLYSIPFCIEPLCIAFSRKQVDRPAFYRMFFSLVILGYIKSSKTLTMVPGHIQDFCYTITAKGKLLLFEHTQGMEGITTISTDRKYATSGIIAAIKPRTIILKNYWFRN